MGYENRKLSSICCIDDKPQLAAEELRSVLSAEFSFATPLGVLIEFSRADWQPGVALRVDSFDAPETRRVAAQGRTLHVCNG